MNINQRNSVICRNEDLSLDDQLLLREYYHEDMQVCMDCDNILTSENVDFCDKCLKEMGL